MWRLHLFLLLSTCFVIPYDAKPTTKTSAGVAGKQVTNLGRLAAKDLAELLVASTQARGLELSAAQQKIVQTLRSAKQPLEKTQKELMLLEVGMDVVIEALIGIHGRSSCGQVIKDIEKSVDKTRLSLALDTFLGLQAFNGIECAPKELVQIIKTATASKSTESDGARITRTALQSLPYAAPGESEQISESVVQVLIKLLQAKDIVFLNRVIESLVSMCGTDKSELLNIMQTTGTSLSPGTVLLGSRQSVVNLIKVRTAISVILALLNGMTSIANGGSSPICQAPANNWVVHLLKLGLTQPIVLSVLNELLEAQIGSAANSITKEELSSNNIADDDTATMQADAPLVGGLLGTATGVLGSASGVGNTLGQSGDSIKGSGNTVNKFVDTNIPVQAVVNVLNNGGSGSAGSGVVNSVGQSGDSIKGSGNTVNKFVDANVPVQAAVNVLNNGGTGSAGSGVVNSVGQSGDSIKGSGNTVNKFVDANVPVQAAVNVLNNGGSGSAGSGVVNSVGQSGDSIKGSGNTVNKFVDTNIPVQAVVNVLNNGGSGSAGSGVVNSVGQSGDSIKGSGNTVNKFVDANVPVQAAVNVLNNGGSGSAGSGVVNSVGQSGDSIKGSGNTVNKFVDANIPVQAAVNLLNNAGGGSAGSGVVNSVGQSGNVLPASGVTDAVGGPREIIKGNNNSVIKVVDVRGNLLLLLNVLSNDGSGSGAGNTLTQDDGTVIIGDDNTVVELINIDLVLLLQANLLSIITGSSCPTGNEPKVGPRTKIRGNRNTLVTLIDANLLLMPNINLLSNIITTLRGKCAPTSSTTTTTTQATPTPSTATPPTPTPSTATPPTPTPTTATTPKPTTPKPTSPSNSVTTINIINIEGDLILNLFILSNVFNAGGSPATPNPPTIIVDNSRTIVSLINIDLNILAQINLLSVITGSSCPSGQLVRAAPRTMDKNTKVVNVIDIDLELLATVNVLSSIIKSQLGNCAVSSTTSTIAPPTEVTPTPAPTTPAPSTGGNQNTLVQVVNIEGNVLVNIFVLSNILNLGGQGAPTRPPKIVMGNNNKIIKLINIDLNILLQINVLSIINGSSCPTANDISLGPDTELVGDNNTLITLIDLNILLLPNIILLSNLLNTLIGNCQATTLPPTPTPTPAPPTPNPNNCYRRYCRKWRTRPSYLCFKNCGGPFTYKP